MGKIKNINSIPTWESKAFGVEIEFVHKPEGSIRMSNRGIAQAIRQRANQHINVYNSLNSPAGVPEVQLPEVTIYGESYNHNTQNYWKVVSDCTAKPTRRQKREGYYGNYELVSPILKGKNAKLHLKFILQAMRELNCDVSRHCGLHVHHDARTWKEQLSNGNEDKCIAKIVNLVTLVTKFENIIFGMLPKSRKPGGSNHRWCRSINNMMNNVFSHINGKSQSKRGDKIKLTKKEIRANGTFGYNFQSDRYCGLNFQSFQKYGSLEFRYGAPTLDFDKLFNWIIFTQRFVISAELFKSVNATNEMSLASEHDIYITFIKVRDSLCLTRRMCKTPEELNASLWIRKRFNEHYAAA